MKRTKVYLQIKSKSNIWSELNICQIRDKTFKNKRTASEGRKNNLKYKMPKISEFLGTSEKNKITMYRAKNFAKFFYRKR